MASPLAALKSFLATKQGKVVAGTGAVGGVVVAGLVARRKAKGDHSGPPGTASPYLPATGTSGMNSGEFPTINTPGIDIGQFEQLLTDIGRIAESFEQAPSGESPPMGAFSYRTFMAAQKQRMGITPIAKTFATVPATPAPSAKTTVTATSPTATWASRFGTKG
jgi:hypothetical protein